MYYGTAQSSWGTKFLEQPINITALFLEFICSDRGVPMKIVYVSKPITESLSCINYIIIYTNFAPIVFGTYWCLPYSKIP